MNDFDILRPGPWFGPRAVASRKPNQASFAHDKAELIDICSLLKSGEFSVKPLLEELILHCNDAAVKLQAIRLYCYISTHEDIPFLGRLLEKSDHDATHSIVIYMPHTLSHQVVPYLFALLEEYEGSAIESDILSSINRIFPFQYEGESVDVAELGERFFGFSKSLNEKKYYYQGNEAFAGNLTKEIIEYANLARAEQSPFPLTHAPTLLSIWSGEKCPVFYGTIVTDSVYERTIEYVKLLASRNWVRGVKYFYGTAVGN